MGSEESISDKELAPLVQDIQAKTPALLQKSNPKKEASIPLDVTINYPVKDFELVVGTIADGRQYLYLALTSTADGSTPVFGDLFTIKNDITKEVNDNRTFYDKLRQLIYELKKLSEEKPRPS